MSIARTPIKPIAIELKPALRKAVDEIAAFLAIWYPSSVVEQSEAALAIAGQWLSRIKGFHDQEDFSNLVRDFLLLVQSGGERSRISDQIAYYFSGFMPSYGAACILIDMVAERRPWSEVQAFMHTLSYGGAKRYVETFDWGGGKQKANAEFKAWVEILKEQAKTLDAAMADAPVLLAQAQPQPAPVYDVPPANDPVMPRPKPSLRLVPPPASGAAAEAAEAAAAEGVGARLLMLLTRIGSVLLLPLMLSGDTPQRDRTRSEALTIPLDKPDADAQTNTTNNECRAQIEDNQKNGATCENDGYLLMEQVLKFKRLVNPPKGKGLDGLFEKLPPLGEPSPMPTTVTQPKPGKLLFLSETLKPPTAAYDFTAGVEKRAASATYPKFVVFEAKHISKRFDDNDTQGITREAKNRLGKTCDGKQMGTKWTAERIPQSLDRQYPNDEGFRERKLKDIRSARYARWIFVCLPGPVGDVQVSKLYVLIDIVSSGMDLESGPPRIRQSKPTSPPNTY